MHEGAQESFLESGHLAERLCALAHAWQQGDIDEAQVRQTVSRHAYILA